MNWLDKYDKDLTSLEKVREEAFRGDLSTSEGFEAFSKDFDVILSPLKGKKIDSEAINLIASRWWNLSRARQMASLRKEIKIQLRLMPLYKKLNTGSRAELSAYGLRVLRRRLQSPLFLKVITQYLNEPQI